MDHGKAYDEPGTVTAEDGEVTMGCPNGVAVRFTPDAALETSDRLLQGGLTAQGQRVEMRQRKASRPDAEPANFPGVTKRN